MALLLPDDIRKITENVSMFAHQSNAEIYRGHNLHITIQGPERVTATGDLMKALSAEDLDLCVMNPPFTRSVGGNLLFGSAAVEEREIMQKKLQQLLNESKVLANVTARLGSVFVALGDHLLKKDGRLALILPRSFLSGVVWAVVAMCYMRRYTALKHVLLPN